MVNWNNTVQFILGEKRLLGTESVVFVLVEEILDAKVSDNRSANLERVLLRLSQVIRHTRFLAVEVSATKLFISNNFTGCSLNKGWSAQKDGSASLDHDDLIRHSGHISATSGATAHNDSNLRDTSGRHASLVKEDSSEVITIRENIILFRKESSSTINQIDTRQLVLFSNFLGTKVFLDSDGVVGSSLVGEVVAENHTLLAVHHTDTSNHIARGHTVIVASELADLEEGRTSINY